MKNHLSIQFAVVSACLLPLACSSTTLPDASQEGSPELGAVEMRLTNDAVREGLATESDAIEPAEAAARSLDTAVELPETDAIDLKQARGKIRELNHSLRDAFQPIVAMIRNDDPTQEAGDLKLWGPVVRGATEYRFLLRNPGPHHYGWRLEGRLADSNERYQRVAAGTITVGIARRRGLGALGVDFDTLASVDPTFQGQGQLLVGFKHGDRGTSVGYALKDFSRSPDGSPGLDAVFRAVHLEPNINRVRLAYHGNVDGTASAAEELVLARIRHLGDRGGRSDLLVTGGDIPAEHAWVISHCWDSTLKSNFRIVRDCPLDGPGGERCTVVSTTGEETRCAAALTNLELPPVNPTDPMPDAEDPNSDVEVPTTFPEVAEAP